MATAVPISVATSEDDTIAVAVDASTAVSETVATEVIVPAEEEEEVDPVEVEVEVELVPQQFEVRLANLLFKISTLSIKSSNSIRIKSIFPQQTSWNRKGKLMKDVSISADSFFNPIPIVEQSIRNGKMTR